MYCYDVEDYHAVPGVPSVEQHSQICPACIPTLPSPSIGPFAPPQVDTPPPLHNDRPNLRVSVIESDSASINFNNSRLDGNSGMDQSTTPFDSLTTNSSSFATIALLSTENTSSFTSDLPHFSLSLSTVIGPSATQTTMENGIETTIETRTFQPTIQSITDVNGEENDTASIMQSILFTTKPLLISKATTESGLYLWLERKYLWKLTYSCCSIKVLCSVTPVSRLS